MGFYKAPVSGSECLSGDSSQQKCQRCHQNWHRLAVKEEDLLGTLLLRRMGEKSANRLNLQVEAKGSKPSWPPSLVFSWTQYQKAHSSGHFEELLMWSPTG